MSYCKIIIHKKTIKWLYELKIIMFRDIMTKYYMFKSVQDYKVWVEIEKFRSRYFQIFMMYVSLIKYIPT